MWAVSVCKKCHEPEKPAGCRVAALQHPKGWGQGEELNSLGLLRENLRDVLSGGKTRRVLPQQVAVAGGELQWMQWAQIPVRLVLPWRMLVELGPGIHLLEAGAPPEERGTGWDESA